MTIIIKQASRYKERIIENYNLLVLVQCVVEVLWA